MLLDERCLTRISEIKLKSLCFYRRYPGCRFWYFKDDNFLSSFEALILSSQAYVLARLDRQHESSPASLCIRRPELDYE
jgi:hypothetical protein